MKHLLKWMNDAEKDLNEAFAPLFSYIKLRQTMHIMVQQITQHSLINDIVMDAKNDDDVVSGVGNIMRTGIKAFVDNNYPHDIVRMNVTYDLEKPVERQSGKNIIIKNGTTFKNCMRKQQLLLANACAIPSMLSDIMEEADMLLQGLETVSNPAYRARLSPIMDSLRKNVRLRLMNKTLEISGQVAKSIMPILANARWGLKTLNTYHFLKHSHKIKLSGAVQKMFEMTDISGEIDISKGLKLPYPMNYIEFDEAITFSEQHMQYAITGALMYEIQTDVIDGKTAHMQQPAYRWRIDQFPKAGTMATGTVHALVGLDQMERYLQEIVDEPEAQNYHYQIDKAYYMHSIVDGEGTKLIDGTLDDGYQSWTGGIETTELPTYQNPTLSGLTTIGYRELLLEGLMKIQHEISNTISFNSKEGKEQAIQNINHIQTVLTHIGNSITDPYYNEGMGEFKKPSNQSYVVIELVITTLGRHKADMSLFSNIGPYIEIGRREGGDKWSTVQDNFGLTMVNNNIEGTQQKMLKAFKIAMQSIWFINEPDVRLREREDLMPSTKRHYFPKRKVTNRRKIVLGGEINRYLKTLQQTIRSSPAGAFWVRGHWRNQWYPSIKDNKRKWIRPYVKGTGKATKKQVDLDPNTEA